MPDFSLILLLAAINAEMNINIHALQSDGKKHLVTIMQIL